MGQPREGRLLGFAAARCSARAGSARKPRTVVLVTFKIGRVSLALRSQGCRNPTTDDDGSQHRYRTGSSARTPVPICARERGGWNTILDRKAALSCAPAVLPAIRGVPCAASLHLARSLPLRPRRRLVSFAAKECVQWSPSRQAPPDGPW